MIRLQPFIRSMVAGAFLLGPIMEPFASPFPNVFRPTVAWNIQALSAPTALHGIGRRTIGTFAPVFRLFQQHVGPSLNIKSTIALALGGRVISDFVFKAAVRPESTTGVMFAAILSAISVASLSVVLYRFFQRIFNSRPGFPLAGNERWITQSSAWIVITGALLGAAIIVPMSYGWVSVGLWSGTVFSAYRFGLWNRRLALQENGRGIVRNGIARRGFIQAFVEYAAAIVGAMAAVIPAFDRKITHYQRSDQAFKQIYGLSEIDPIDTSESITNHWEEFSETFTRMERGGLSVAQAETESVRLEDAAFLLSFGIDPLPAHKITLLERFILHPQLISGGSFAARERILSAKRGALNALLRSLDDAKDLETGLRFVQLLKRLASHQERTDQKDPRFPAFGFSEKDVLTLKLRYTVRQKLTQLIQIDELGAVAQAAENVLHDQSLDPLMTDELEEDSYIELRIYQQWIHPCSDFAEYLLERERVTLRRNESVHAIPISMTEAIKEIRSWPKPFVAALREGAPRARVPPEVLAANLFEVTERQYSLREAAVLIPIRVFGMTSYDAVNWNVFNLLSRVISFIVPPLSLQADEWIRVIADRKFPSRWTDLAGVFLNTHSTVGPYQFRPHTAGKAVPSLAKNPRLTSWKLMDEPFNARVWADAWGQALREMDDIRLRLGWGESIDIKSLAKEGSVQIMPWMIPELYRLLPPLEGLGPDDRWRLMRFHWQLRNNSDADPAYQLAVLRAGIFDSPSARDAVFTRIESTEDLAKLEHLFKSREEFMRATATRTLIGLAQQPGPHQKRAQEILEKESHENAPMRGRLTLGAAGMILASVVKNPRLSRRALLSGHWFSRHLRSAG